VAKNLRSEPFGPQLFALVGVAEGRSFARSVTSPIAKAQTRIGRRILEWDEALQEWSMTADDATAVLDFLGDEEVA
jgi:hypothetical protein